MRLHPRNASSGFDVRRARAVTTGLVLLGVLSVAAPASAQIVQSISVNFGGFFPRGFDSRVDGDAIVADLTFIDPLAFPEVENCFLGEGFSNPSDCVKGFRSTYFSGEWQAAFGNRLELGIGVGYHGKTVFSVYRDLLNELPGGERVEIPQDLRLRIVPATFLVRFLPFGQPGDVQPYAGVGVSALVWRYSEVGDFVDTDELTVFNDRFIATGTTVAPVVALGARFPLGGDIYALTTEYRYQWGSGNTGGEAAGFLGDKIDLSGGTFTFGFLIRY
jgi:hypothetical protein